MARPSKYETHVKPKLNLVEAWARDGLVDEQIAHNLGIAMSTYYDYKNTYTEFSEALKNGKDDIDIMVENALLKRAMGYEFEEVTQEPLYNSLTGEPILNEFGDPKIAVTKIVRKQVVPDTTAQIFWLKNRRPQAWRDKQEIKHEGEIGFKKLEDFFS
ncbi:transposase [Paenibacillus naphthalenovorans]|uniref:transposase n=1 Tax=Paenibacillus naphthalenovorans TaxID=162209 RepID=UPI0010B63ADB|nr:transposase [Paenibacillus naphthalenovorans]GCL71784.1 transposase [Paenibacillus naphthalenovorans]